MFKTIKRTAAALTVAAGLILGTALAGNALTYDPNPIYEGQPITVVSSSSNLPAGDYKISVCTTRGFGFLHLIPACAEGTAYSLKESGRITVTIPGISRKGNANVHHIKWLPSQPADFSCENRGDCEILIVLHKGIKKIEEREPIEVLPKSSSQSL